MKKDNMNSNEMTIEALRAELELTEAEQKGLTSKKKSLKRRLAELEGVNANKTAEVVEEAPVEEVEAAAEVVEEAPAEEVEAAAEVVEEAPVEEVEAAAEVVEEAPVEEVEAAAEVVEEAPVEEVEAAAEVVEEAPAEEVETATEVVEEAPVEEVEAAAEVVEEAPAKEVEAAAEVVEEAPAEEVEAAIEVVEEAPAEEVETAAEVVEKAPNPEENPNQNENSEKKDSFWKNFFILVGKIVGIAAIVALLVALIVVFGNKNSQTPEDPDNSINGEVPADPDNNEVPGDSDKEEVPGDSDNNDIPSENVFDMDAFKEAVVNIAGTYTNNADIEANANIFVENIGKDKLVELVGKYDEVQVKKAIAEIVAFAPEVKKQQYIIKNELNYNPNAVIDYSNKLQELDDTYRNATGKNPDGALMSLPGYDSYNGNREALRAMINDSGDIDLLTWYNAKMEIYDTMRIQTKDTENALAYEETVKAELLASKGSVKLLELQLEKEVSGELVAVDNASMQYTEDYYNFILNNYIYVVAN